MRSTSFITCHYWDTQFADEGAKGNAMNCMCCSHMLSPVTDKHTMYLYTVLWSSSSWRHCTRVLLYSSVGAPPCKLECVGSTVTPTWPQTTVHTSACAGGRPRTYSASVGSITLHHPSLLSAYMDRLVLQQQTLGQSSHSGMARHC